MSEKKITIQKATTDNVKAYGELLDATGTEPAFDSEVFSFWNDLSVGTIGESVSFGMYIRRPERWWRQIWSVTSRRPKRSFHSTETSYLYSPSRPTARGRTSILPVRFSCRKVRQLRSTKGRGITSRWYRTNKRDVPWSCFDRERRRRTWKFACCRMRKGSRSAPSTGNREKQ